MNAQLLTALLRGGEIDPAEWLHARTEAFWEAAERHGVTPLVASILRERHDAPPQLNVHARELERAEAVANVLGEHALRRLLDALAVSKAAALLMKGGLLAHLYYPRPELRQRLDTDVLIRPADRTTAHDVLTGLGYRPHVQATRDIASHQRPYIKKLHGALDHVIDVHWRLANPEVFGHVLTFDEMAEQAVPVTPLGASARGLSPVHSLLVACVHRVAHHLDDERLIWLYDIHLIAGRLTDDQWEDFRRLAEERRVTAICDAGLKRTISLFGTRVPAGAIGPAQPGSELTAGYLSRERSRLDALMDDLRTLGSWTDRWRLMRDYAFPPVEYMRQVYAPSSAAPLPWLYARRVVTGARKWLGHPRST